MGGPRPGAYGPGGPRPGAYAGGRGDRPTGRPWGPPGGSRWQGPSEGGQARQPQGDFSPGDTERSPFRTTGSRPGGSFGQRPFRSSGPRPGGFGQRPFRGAGPRSGGSLEPRPFLGPEPGPGGFGPRPEGRQGDGGGSWQDRPVRPSGYRGDGAPKRRAGDSGPSTGTRPDRAPHEQRDLGPRGPRRPGFGFTDEYDWTGPERRPLPPEAERPEPPTPAEREEMTGHGPDRPAPRPVPGRAPRPIVGRGQAARGAGAPAPWRRPTPAAPAIPLDDLLGEDEEIVAGRHPVEEAFIARRQARRLLVVPQRRQALEKLVLHATNLRIPIVEVEGGTLTSLAGFDGHQGIALVTDRRRFADLDAILARAIERGEPPFILVLDSLEDPQNFGSLLRTAEASGVHGVIYPTHRQAPLSAAAIKSSAGAVEHLLMAPVEDLAEALTDLHIRGLRIVGTDAEAPLTAREADLRGPTAIAVGSEGQGLGPAVRRRCDTLVRIPMRGHVGSLNASVAGSILLYEAASQRGDRSPNRLVAGLAPGLAAERAPEPGAPAATTAEVPTAAVEAPTPAEPAAAKVRRPRKAARPPKTTPATPENAARPDGEAALPEEQVATDQEALLPGGSVSGPVLGEAGK